MSNSNKKSPSRNWRIFCRHDSACATLVLFSLATLFTVAIDAEGSKIEANHGENVTLSFPMDKAEEADRLRISFFKEGFTKQSFLISQNCAPHEGCDVVHTPGVSVIVAGECVRVTVQNVNISRSGLYKAETYFGKDVYEEYAILVVNEAPVSSSPSPPHSSSSPKPPRSSDLHWLYALITAVFIIIIIFILCFCFWKHGMGVRNMNQQQMLKEKLQPSPDPESQQKELENMIV